MANHTLTKPLFVTAVTLLLLLTLHQKTSAQSCLTPPAGMVSWWPADSSASDIFGPNNGSLVNGVAFTNGEVGQAFDFGGTSDFVHISNNQNLNFTPSDDYTIDLWLKAQPHNTLHPALVEKWNDDTLAGYPYVVRLNTGAFGPTGTVTGAVFDGHTYIEVVSASRVDDDTWHLVAVVFRHSRKRLEIYIDGRLENSTAYDSLGNISNDLPVIFGLRPASAPDRQAAFEYNGLLDEVEIFNRALTASEIQSIYDAGRAGKCRTITVAIDVKPGSFPNSINLGSNGVVPVAILSSATFDARTTDPATVTLSGAPVKLKGNGAPMASFQDVNGDGRPDLLVHVSTTALQLSKSDTEATLNGRTFDGRYVRATDSVRIVP